MNQPTHPTPIKEAFDQLFGEGNFERITETFGSVQILSEYLMDTNLKARGEPSAESVESCRTI